VSTTTRSRFERDDRPDAGAEEADAAAARRNYAILCVIATAAMAGVVGGVIALFLQ